MTETIKESLIILSELISRHKDPRSVQKNRWPEIIQLALQHGAGPMLWQLIRMTDMDISFTERKLLKTSVYKTVVHLISLEQAQVQIGAALAEKSIPAIWLKGLALAYTVYPEPLLRPMCDLDVLVPFEQRESALKIVCSLGYCLHDASGLLHHNSASLTHKMSHHYQLIGGTADSVMVELHFRLFDAQPKILSFEDMQWFWTQTQFMSIENSRFTILKPEAQLLYIIAHAVLHHREIGFFLRSYLDLHLLIIQSNIDWCLVVEKTIAFKWVYAVDKALRIIKQCFSTPIPDFVINELQHGCAGTKDIFHVTKALDRGVRWEKMMSSFSRLTFSDCVRVGLKVVFPPTAYMRFRYTITSQEWVWGKYLYRWLDQLREIWAWFCSVRH